MVNEFTEWVKALVLWLQETGILDAWTDMVTDITVESIYAVLVLLISAISSLAVSGIILVALAIATVVIVVAALVFYVLRAVGLSRIAKKMGVKNRFLAWIPYGFSYLLGACAEQSAKRNGKKTWKWGLILLFTTLGMGIGQPVVQLALTVVLSVLPVLSALVTFLVECSSIILLAMMGYCLWCIFKEYMDHVPALILAILGALCGTGVFAVMLFVMGFLKLRPASENEAAAACVAVIDT
ncbi:MAG: hypothetical protein II330_08400 [Clostridia bacterium]|nr:hypothetical protein [Clostridia bacterium]